MRPLSLGEVLDAAIQLVRRSFGTLAVIVLVIGVPVAIVSLLITTSTTEPCTDLLCDSGDSAYYTDSGTYAAGLIATTLLTALQTLLVTVGCFEVITASYLGRRVSAGSSLRFALRRGAAVLWIGLLSGLAIALGLICLIVPGIYLAVAFGLALPVLLVEGLRGTEALGRSRALVSDRWWPTFGTLAVAYIITIVPASLLGGAVAALTLTDAVDAGSLLDLGLQQAISLLISVFTTPFLGAVFVLVYFDLRVRKEGFDLQVLAAQLGGASVLPDRYGSDEPAPAPAEPTGWQAPASGSVAPGEYRTPAPPPAAGPAAEPTPAPAARPEAAPAPQDDGGGLFGGSSLFGDEDRGGSSR